MLPKWNSSLQIANSDMLYVHRAMRRLKWCRVVRRDTGEPNDSTIMSSAEPFTKVLLSAERKKAAARKIRGSL